MDELSELKKKRLDELKKIRIAELQQQMQQQSEIQEQIGQLEDFVRPYLTKEALARYGNLRTAHPEKAVQVMVLFAQAIQGKKISRIDDNTLREVLQRLTPPKRDFKIKKI